MAMQYHKCLECGKEFYSTAWNRQYCSAKCARTAQARKNMSHIARRSAIKSVIPPKMLYAFHFHCCICGWYLKQDYESINYHPQHGCEFHHIVPVSEGGENTLDNIVLLCPNCHKSAHAGIIPKDELKKHLKTIEDAEMEREALAHLTGIGTYMIDEIYLNKGNFRKRFYKGENV